MVRRHLITTLTIVTLAGPLAASAQPAPRNEAPPDPRPARNEVVRPQGPFDEVLMLRHQYLDKGAHEIYYQASRFGVWPWYERLGTRITGQWQVVYPEGGEEPLRDEGYRLARYASFEHWRYTRGPLSQTLAGNGPNLARSGLAGQLRREVAQGSKGGYFLQGLTATIKPQFLPGFAEEYEQIGTGVPGPDDDVIAVRNDVEQPGVATIALRYARIEKGSFERILETTLASVWPYEEKLGARPIGQWKVIYPDAPSRTKESHDYDEMVTMGRYASYDHYRAMRRGQAVLLGGNGRDWEAWRRALDTQGAATLEETVEFLQGFDHWSPPTFQPALPERYESR